MPVHSRATLEEQETWKWALKASSPLILVSIGGSGTKPHWIARHDNFIWKQTKLCNTRRYMQIFLSCITYQDGRNLVPLGQNLCPYFKHEYTRPWLWYSLLASCFNSVSTMKPSMLKRRHLPAVGLLNPAACRKAWLIMRLGRTQVLSYTRISFSAFASKPSIIPELNLALGSSVMPQAFSPSLLKVRSALCFPLVFLF